MFDNITKIVDRMKENKELAEENSQVKRGKKIVEKELEEMRNKYDEKNEKYIKLLEEKGDGFDKYLHYHNAYADAALTLKENKKDIAELKAEVRELTEINNEKDLELEKLRKKVERYE